MAPGELLQFGDLLRLYRLAAGLTQEELAEQATLSAKGIGALERGERQIPHRNTVWLLVDVLGLSGAEREEFEAAASPGLSPTLRTSHSTSRASPPRAQLDEATWSAAWSEGRAMTTDEAIACALNDGTSL